MISNVESIDKLTEDICNCFDIVPEYLQERIMDMAEEASKQKDYTSSFFELSERFISEYTSEKINEVFLCHLTRSIDCPTVLMPLQALLTTDNSFSSFLKEHCLEFRKEGNCIGMWYKGRHIPRKQLYDSTRFENDHVRLAGRLGYVGEKDYCVNGFAFAIDLENSTDGYYQNLMDGPELLQDLDDFLGTNLSEEYRKRTKYYLALAKVPLKDIIFDDRPDLNIEGDRTNAFLTVCFEFLLSWYSRTRWSQYLHNEIIRINDYSSVCVDHYIELPSR